MGPAVFKTVEGAKAPWRVRFPSTSAKCREAQSSTRFGAGFTTGPTLSWSGSARMNTDPVVGDLDDHLIAISKAGDRTRGFVESLYLKPFWMTF